MAQQKPIPDDEFDLSVLDEPTKAEDDFDLSVLDEPTPAPIEQVAAPIEPTPVESMGRKIWNFANKPLADVRDFARSVSDRLTSGDETFGPDYPTLNKIDAMRKGFLGGAAEGLGNVVTEATTPVNLASMALSGGAGFAAKRGLGTAAGFLGNTARIPDIMAAGHGGETIINPDATMSERAMGAAELLGGAAGAFAPVPKFNPAVAQDLMPPTAAIPEAVPTQVIDDIIPESLAPVLPETIASPELAAASLPESVNSLSDYSASSELRARKILGDAGADIEGMTNKQIIDEARTQQALTNPRSIPTKPKVKVRFDKATNSLVPDTDDAATVAIVEALKTKTPVPQEARIPPKEMVEIPEKPELTGDELKDKATLADWLSIPRAMQSAYDLSFPLRQGIGLAHTAGWWKAWPDMVKSFGSEAAYKGVIDSIIERPNHRPVPQMRNGRPIIGKDGLPAMGPSFADEMGLADSSLSTLNKREENLGSSLAERIPILGRGIRASNRAYTAFARKLRADTFDSLILDAEKAGLNPREDKVLGKAVATYVNNASGRGDLGKTFEPAAVALNNLLFSPRLMASRLQMMNPQNWAMQQPFVRKQYWKSMASVVGAYSTFTAMNHLAGGTTPIDDPQSSEFGRTKIGNTRFDPSGGFLPYLTLFARIGKGGVDKIMENKGGRYDNKFPFNTPQADLGNFFSNKAQPYLAQGFKLGGANKNRPYEVSDQALRMFTPIMLQDLSELLKEDPSIAPFGIAQAAIGIGVNNYESGKVSPRFLPENLDPFAKSDFNIPRSFQRR